MRLVVVLILMLLILRTAEGAEYARINASEILTNISKGLPVEYDHVIVTGDLNLNNLKGLNITHINRTNPTEYFGPLQDLRVTHFSRSEDAKVITSPIRISDSIIEGTVNFKNIIFENTTYFVSSKFNGYANFSYSSFNDYADFSHSTFNSTADFTCSTFNSYAWFWNSTFNNNAYFSGSEFNDGVLFIASTFNSNACFWDSTFNNSDIDFRNSEFNYNVFFGGSKFNRKALFAGSKFNSYTYFADSVFNSTAEFEGSKFNGTAIFYGAAFKDTLNLKFTEYNKLYIRWDENCNLAYDDTSYQLLIENLKKLGFMADADVCYYQFRVAQFQHQNWKDDLFMYIINLGAWKFYGYGKKPIYPVFWSVSTILFFGGLWGAIGLRRKIILDEYDVSWDRISDKHYKKSLWGKIYLVLKPFIFSSIIFLSGTKLFVDPPDKPVIPGIPILLINGIFNFERVLGAFFSILLFIAIGATIVK